MWNNSAYAVIFKNSEFVGNLPVLNIVCASYGMLFMPFIGTVTVKKFREWLKLLCIVQQLYKHTRDLLRPMANVECFMILNKICGSFKKWLDLLKKILFQQIFIFFYSLQVK